jgi:hypothetical protein
MPQKRSKCTRPPSKGYHYGLCGRGKFTVGCRVVSCNQLKATYANVKKYHATSRKSPPLPGNHSLCRGTVQRGNDNKFWHSKELRPDVFRWVRAETCKKPKAKYPKVKNCHESGRKSPRCSEIVHGATGRRQKKTGTRKNKRVHM